MPAETASNCAGLRFHQVHKAISCGVHATGIYGRGDQKDAGWRRLFCNALRALRFRQIPGRELSALESGGMVRLRLLRSQETLVRLDNTTFWVVAIHSLPAPTVMPDQAIDLPSVR